MRDIKDHLAGNITCKESTQYLARPPTQKKKIVQYPETSIAPGNVWNDDVAQELGLNDKRAWMEIRGLSAHLYPHTTNI